MKYRVKGDPRQRLVILGDYPATTAEWARAEAGDIRAVNRAGFPGDRSAWVTRQGLRLGLGMVARLRLSGSHVAYRLEEAAVVEPVHPSEGGELDGLQGAPWATPPDHLGLEQADDALGKPLS